MEPSLMIVLTMVKVSLCSGIPIGSMLSVTRISPTASVCWALYKGTNRTTGKSYRVCRLIMTPVLKLATVTWSTTPLVCG